MIRCKECVIPDTRPDTEFVDGVCSACLSYKSRPKVNWDARLDELKFLIGRAKFVAKSRGNHYDCIVPSSGGKDSHYQVIQLLSLGARPLVVTATTCQLTPTGRRNIDNLSRYATTLELTPNRTVRATLNRAGMRMVGDISWPEHVSIFTMPFKMASRLGIPYLFYGENPQNQYGGPMDATEASEMTRRWVSEFGGFLGMRPQDLIGVDGLTEADMDDYMIKPTESVGVQAHFLGQYIQWDSHRNAEVARAAGMEQKLPSPANYWSHENLDNAQTGIHDHMMYRKYGFGRGAAQISVDVRAGLISREDALSWVKKFDGGFPYMYAGVPSFEVLERIGMEKQDFKETMDKFTDWALFEGDPSLRTPERAPK